MMKYSGYLLIMVMEKWLGKYEGDVVGTPWPSTTGWLHGNGQDYIFSSI